MNLKDRIKIAHGERPCDILLKNAQVVSVFSGTIEKTDVAIADGLIVGFGAYKAKKDVDLNGAYLSAGFIDSHIHIESTHLSPAYFAEAVVSHGTTSVVADPHEIANVLGEKGIHFMLEASRNLPIDIYIALPSCVPSSTKETSGAKLTSEKLKKFVDHPRVIGIGEVMDWPSVINTHPDLLAKLKLKPGMRIDGHAPGVHGKDLYAYIMGNICSDHESVTAAEALEKLKSGLHIMIREGSSAKNLAELVKMVTPINAHRVFFCSDDLNPADIISHGHMDEILRKAVKLGMDPITALQLATNNAPYYFRLPEKKGAVAIGYQADLVVLDDLKEFKVRQVYKNGKLVAENGKLLSKVKQTIPKFVKSTMHVKKFDVSQIDGWHLKHHLIGIELVPGQIVTKKFEFKNEDVGIDNDILKLIVVERHKHTGNIGIGFARGFGIKKGAFASSVAHDSHNIVAVGVNDDEIYAAIQTVIKAEGGIVAVSDGVVRAMLKLPIAGLMSDRPADEVVSSYKKLLDVAKEFGSKLDDPYQSLSFLSLPVIPEIRLTDKGLIIV